MSRSDRTDEFNMEAESDEDFGLDEGLVDSDIAKSIANILADVPVAQAEVLPNGAGEIDIRATSTAMDTVFADVDGVIFNSGDLADPFGSGTGQYGPFLSLRDSNQMPLDSDGVATGFNVDSTSDPLLNDLIFANSRTNAVALSNLVIITVEGEEFFEIRLDLNEPDSGTDSQLQITDLTMYFGDGSIDSYAGLAGATPVWDLDGTADGDLTLQLNDNFSGSGTDDYQILIPVSLFEDAGADFSADFFFLEVTAGSDDPTSEFAMEGGFFEFNIQEGGSVSGIKFLDSNNNGVLDGGEGAPADSFIIYVDANEDGQLNFTDDGDGILEFNGDDIILERYTETAPDGSYEITGLEVGTYQIREYLPPDSLYEGPTTGAFETVTVVVDTNTVVDPIGNFLPDPQIGIIKEVTAVDGSEIDLFADEAGDLIEYQITVTTADGNIALSNVVVTDPLLADLSFVGGDTNDNSILDLDESWIYEGSYTVLQSDFDNNGGGDGDIDNTAEANSTEAGPVEASAAVPLILNPQITIDKEVTAVDGDDMNLVVDEAGDVIDYRITVGTGTGNVNLTNVMVSDPLLADLAGVDENMDTFNDGDTDMDGVLDVGEEWIYTGSYTATQEDINNNGGGDGDIDNTAEATSDEVGPVTDSAAVPIEQNPDITIIKEVTAVDGDDMNLVVDEAGDVIDYRITVGTGTSNVDLTNVVVTDPLLADLAGVDENMDTFNDGDTDMDGVLDVGEEWIYTGSYTATQEDINDNGGGDGDIDNTAQVVSDQAGPAESSADVPIDRNPQITIDKEVTAVDGDDMNLVVDEAGDVIDYRITVGTGTGNVDLTNVMVTDPLLADLAGVDENMDTFNDGDTDMDGVLDVGEEWIYTGSYTATQEDINDNGGGDGDIDNTAEATSDEAGPVTDSAAVPIDQNPDITIVKEVTAVDGSEVDLFVNEVGDVIDYRITVGTGTGNIDLTNVVVTDPLLADLVPLDEDMDTFNDGDTDMDGVLDVGEEWIYTGSYTATQNDIDTDGGGDGDIDNTAQATSTEAGPVESSVAVPIERDPQITIDKEVTAVDGDDMNLVVDEAGDVIDYRITVGTGTGNVNLTNVVVTDPLLSDLASVDENMDTFNDGDTDMDGVLDVGEEWIYTGSYTATQEDINNNGGGDGDIDNTAEATSDEVGPVTDSAAVPIEQNPDITIIKEVTAVDGDDMNLVVDEAGDVIDYRITVGTGTSNVDLTNVVVTDPLLADLAGVDENMDTFNDGDTDMDGVLDVGEEWIYTGSYTATQEDINDNGGGDGDIDNTAEATSDEVGPVEDSAAVEIDRNPQITIDKEVTAVDGDDMNLVVDEAGDVIDYRITVGTGTGNVDLTNVVVTDPLLADLAGVDENMDTFNDGDTDMDGVLDIGEEWIYTGSYTATQEDINDNGGGDGDIDNTAQVVSDQAGPAESSADVPIDRNPQITIDKEVTAVDGDDMNLVVDEVGDVIDYRITVGTGTGNVDLTNVVVTDPLLADLAGVDENMDTFNDGDTDMDGVLDVGEEWIYTGSYTATQEDINNNGGGDGDIDNTAEATSDEVGPVTDSAAVPIEQNPDITIIKEVTAVDGDDMNLVVDEAGDVIDYRITVGTGTSNVDLTNVVVTDPLLADLAGVDENMDTFNDGDTDMDGVLDVGEEWIYTGSYTATQEDINDNGGGDGDIDNTAEATSDEVGPVTDSAAVPIEQNPDITIIKEVTAVDGDDMNLVVDEAGDVIDYRITVGTGTSNVDLTNVVVTDPLLADLAGVDENVDTFNDGDTDMDGVLDIGEEWIYTGSYTATQEDINDNGGGDGDIDNTAQVVSDQAGPAESSADVPIDRNPQITIDKEVTAVDGDDMNLVVDEAGDVIDYRITVGTGTGNVDLTNVVVTDPLLSDLAGVDENMDTFNDGDTDMDGVLDVGEEWIYTGSYTATQQDINDNGGGDGDIDNTAEATSDEVGPVTDSAAVEIDRNPQITIDKEVTAVDGDDMNLVVDEAGDVIDYRITVGTGTGNVDLTNVMVTDPLLADLAGVDENMDTFNDGDTDMDGVLDVGEEWIYTGSYTATQEDINDNGGGDGDIDNTAEATSDEVGPVTDSAAVEIDRNPQIAIDKEVTAVDGDDMNLVVDEAGDVIDYRITVGTGTGNVNLTNVVVTDPLLSDLASVDENMDTFNDGDTDMDGVLDVGEEWIYTGSYTATQEDINDNGGGDGDIDNTAEATSDEVGPVEDSAAVEIDRNPQITIDKEVTAVDGDDMNLVVDEAGDVIDYRITVGTGTGNVDLTNVMVSDPLLADLAGVDENMDTFNDGDADMDGVLDVGEEWIYTGSYEVTQEDIDNDGGGDGDIDNTAEATSSEVGPVEASADVPILIPEVELIKEATVTNPDMSDGMGIVNEVGDVINYTITVDNTGDVDLTGVMINDPLPGALILTGDDGDDGILGVDETWVYTGSYTVTQADIDSFGGVEILTDGDIQEANQIDNLAIVTTAEGVMSMDDGDIPVVVPGIDIAKEASVEDGGIGVDEVGDVINYLFTVINTGNVALTNVAIEDPLVANLSDVDVDMDTFNDGDINKDNILDIDETWTFEGSYTITQADIDNAGLGEIITPGDVDQVEQIDNLAIVTTDEGATDEDDADIPLLLPPDGWFGTPGFWINHCEFFDGDIGNEPKQSGQEYFPDGEMTITVADDAPFYAGETGIWLNFNDDNDDTSEEVVDEGEFWSVDWLKDALEGGGKGPRNSVDTLARDLAALVLNISASPDSGSDSEPDTVDPIQLIQWAQQWLDMFGGGTIRPNADEWKLPQFDGAPSASDLHNFIDQLNNTGSFDGNEEFPGGTFGEDRDFEEEEIEEGIEAFDFQALYVPGDLFTIKYSAPEESTVAELNETPEVSKEAFAVGFEGYLAEFLHSDRPADEFVSKEIGGFSAIDYYSYGGLFTIKNAIFGGEANAESPYQASAAFLAAFDDANLVQALAEEEHLFYDANDLIDVA